MAAPSRHWTAMCVKAARLLEDGQWHDYDEIREALFSEIPAWAAFRTNEEERVCHLKGRDDEPYRPRKIEIPKDDAILSGRRRISARFLQTNCFEQRYVTRIANDTEQKIREIRMVRKPKRARFHELNEARRAKERLDRERQEASDDDYVHHGHNA